MPRLLLRGTLFAFIRQMTTELGVSWFSEIMGEVGPAQRHLTSCGCLISPVGSAGAELQEGTLEGQGDSCPQRAVTMSCQEN